ncbi:uncharacterized protein LAESUDRAFT_724114 [Laetiporus sulphureus 93-53]|uniref:Uncharacterized protein n=1 Tax=Laetiporus sulphureus 93-53 TaxID=1314785 RepID=A0A165F0M6_9APHY|nr:uncharacterized protein LAESUDRAFT_724114 [Laetiporus sulphureus 93-53]KZT08113.1 hypothetical protein LAESUDRAFT_724114 [Laetiporus sulphureus 93-53]
MQYTPGPFIVACISPSRKPHAPIQNTPTLHHALDYLCSPRTSPVNRPRFAWSFHPAFEER